MPKIPLRAKSAFYWSMLALVPLWVALVYASFVEQYLIDSGSIIAMVVGWLSYFVSCFCLGMIAYRYGDAEKEKYKDMVIHDTLFECKCRTLNEHFLLAEKK